MKHATLEKWLKFVIIGMAFCGVVVYGWGLPCAAESVSGIAPDFGSLYLFWYIFLLAAMIPCYAVLILAWRIATNIGKGRAFSYANGKAFRGICWMAASDTVFFFAGNVGFLLLNRNYSSLFFFSMIVVFIGIAITVCAKAMSHLVDNAAAMQEENDGTI